MGTFGSGIFDDDLALDIQGSFLDAISAGEPIDKIVDNLLMVYAEIKDDTDEGPVLYLTLASLLIDQNVHKHAVIDRALSILKNEEGLDRWREAGTKELEERQSVYRELELKYNKL